MRHLGLCLIPLIALTAPASRAQDGYCAPDAMLVFDGSGSMAEMGFNYIDEPRIFEARRAVGEILPQVQDYRRIGLVLYGPGGVDSCTGVDLRFAPVPRAAERVITDVEALSPTGDTPLTDAVALAARTLEYRSRPGTIVLVTDGKETCGGAPCQLATELRHEGHDLTVHVIGFKVRGDRFSYNRDSDYVNSESVAKCLADQTGGHYHATETADELIEALRRTLGCQLLL